MLRELPVLLLIAFVLALVVKTFFVQAFFIPSGSMEQTLHGCTGCRGDRVLVNKIPYWFGEPEPGEIVVFKGPDTWAPEVSVAEPSNWFSGAMLWLGRTVGVERTFPVHTPVVEKIEVLTRGDVRRAKLYYLRELRGKAAKIKEKREPIAR